MTARSWLFVPGDSVEKMEGAPLRGADAVIVDLEDAVAVEAKASARDMVADWLDSRDTATTWVRVNNEPQLLADDVAAVVPHDIAGIVVPKLADAAQAADVADSLGDAVGLVAMVETAGALLDAVAIASTPGVTTLMVGEYDLAAELGMDPSPDRHELAPARAMVVLACAAAGIAPPIGPVSADFVDLDAFRAGCESLRREGHRGRAVIHPAQVEPANEAFTPSAAEITRARRTLELYEAAREAGRGVLIDDAGNLLDEAIVRGARQTIETAIAAGLV